MYVSTNMSIVVKQQNLVLMELNDFTVSCYLSTLTANAVLMADMRSAWGPRPRVEGPARYEDRLVESCTFTLWNNTKHWLVVGRLQQMGPIWPLIWIPVSIDLTTNIAMCSIVVSSKIETYYYKIYLTNKNANEAFSP